MPNRYRVAKRRLGFTVILRGSRLRLVAKPICRLLVSRRIEGYLTSQASGLAARILGVGRS